MADEKVVTIIVNGKNLTGPEFEGARKALAGLRKETDDSSKSSKGFFGDLVNIKSGLGMVAGAFTGFVSAQAILGGISAAMGFVKDAAFGMNASLEKSTLQFTTLMGDSEKARQHVQNLFEFAKKTPFETEPIIQASRMLQTFGGEALNSLDRLTKLGDASAATSAPIEELSFWVGRMYANLQAGKPFGEAAQRLTELAVLSPQTRNEMERLAESGANGGQVFAAFEDSLGRFTGAMQTQAGTWDGLTSTFSDTLQLLVANGMTPVFEASKKLLAGINEFLGSDAFARQAQGLADAFSQGLADGIQFAGRAWDVFSTAATGVWDALRLVWDASTAVLEKLGLMNVLQGLATNLVNGLALSLQAVGGGLSWVADKIRSLLEWVGLLTPEAETRTPSALYKTDIALGAVSASATKTADAFGAATGATKKERDAIGELADTFTGKGPTKKLLDMVAALERAEKQGGVSAAATRDLGKQISDLVDKGGRLPPALHKIWVEYQSGELRTMALAGGTDILTGKLDKLTRAKLGSIPAWMTWGDHLRDAARDLSDLDDQIRVLPGHIKELAPPPEDPWRRWKDSVSGAFDDLSLNLSSTLASMVTGWDNFWSGLKDTAKRFMGEIVNALTTSFINPLIQRLVGAQSPVGQAMAQMFGAPGTASASGLASAASAGGSSAGQSWGSAFASQAGSILGSVFSAYGITKGFMALGSWLGGGPSPERWTGIEHDEYVRRYGSSSDAAPGLPEGDNFEDSRPSAGTFANPFSDDYRNAVRDLYGEDPFPGFATGGIASGRQLAWLAERGQKEIVGSESFMADALAGALQRVGVAPAPGPSRGPASPQQQIVVPIIIGGREIDRIVIDVVNQAGADGRIQIASRQSARAVARV